ncbi:MAG TPA: glutamyl-tRNA reductase, partial [Pirellulales bacterium]
VDALRDVCERNQRERRRELDGAMAIVEEETRRFLSDLHHRSTGPVIRRLRDDWKVVQTSEMERLFNKLPNLDEKSKAAVRESFDRLVNKLLHPPLESLRDESRQGSATLLEALKKLFRLGE